MTSRSLQNQFLKISDKFRVISMSFSFFRHFINCQRFFLLNFNNFQPQEQFQNLYIVLDRRIWLDLKLCRRSKLLGLTTKCISNLMIFQWHLFIFLTHFIDYWYFTLRNSLRDTLTPKNSTLEQIFQNFRHFTFLCHFVFLDIVSFSMSTLQGHSLVLNTNYMSNFNDFSATVPNLNVNVSLSRRC